MTPPPFALLQDEEQESAALTKAEAQQQGMWCLSSRSSDCLQYILYLLVLSDLRHLSRFQRSTDGVIARVVRLKSTALQIEDMKGVLWMLDC